MKAITARLMRLQRYSAEQVLKLHKLEAEAEKRFQAFLADPKANGSAPLDYFSAGNIIMLRWDSDLGNYWDAQKTDSEKGVEVERFERAALPILRRHGVSGPDPLNETPAMDAMHQIDDAVLRQGYRVNTARGLNASSKLGAFMGD